MYMMYISCFSMVSILSTSSRVCGTCSVGAPYCTDYASDALDLAGVLLGLVDVFRERLEATSRRGMLSRCRMHASDEYLQGREVFQKP